MTDVAHLSDSALLAAFAKGDRDAARHLSARLLPRVMGQAVRMLADRGEAEDVAQDAMMRLWRIAPDWRDGEAQVSTWLYRVTANLCTDRLRKRRSTVGMDDLAEPADPVPAVVGMAMIGAMASASARVHQSPMSSKSQSGRV